MAASTSSTSVLSAGQHTKPEYTNWLALSHALTTVLCQGLRPFINRETATFYNNLTARLVTAAPCTCVYVPGRKPNQYHDMSTCAWANVLQNHHDTNRPNWKQSDSTKWLDPNLGPWEIAKLFVPDLGGHAVINSADDMDVTGILNLMYWCNHFTIPQHLVKDVRNTRNNKWVHVPKLELTDADKKIAFDAIENLLKDPIFAHDPDAQRALREIQTLKCFSDLNNFQAQVLTQYKEMIENDMSVLKNEIRNLKEENRHNQELREQLEGRLYNMQKALENVTNVIQAGYSFASLAKNRAPYMFNYLFKCTRTLKKLLMPWLMTLLLCSMVTILDPRSYKDGCPEEESSVPFETKDINMSEHLIAAQAENFIGRQWLYREVESILENGDLSGVLILGNPGAGKSALSSQLICSRTTSYRIHSHILGYHFCKYSDKNTQMAGKFVRNLAEMIARRLPEYGYLVSNKSYIQRSFETDCIQNQDPVGCFEQTILSPLRNLKNEPRENWYIVLDALDECLSQGETSHSIVYLLNNKINRFPPWLKLIMTSRNDSDASLHSSKIKEFIIDPEDSRNIQDIDLFLMERLYQESPLSYWIRSWSGDDSVDSTSKLIKVLLSNSQGNFLFIKEVLKHWELSRHELKDAYSLPKTLGDVYHSYFERLYSSTRKKSFNSARRVLELLVATFEPLTQTEIFEILRMREKDRDEEYDFKNILKELGHFLKYGRNGTVTLYHLSLTEWLTTLGNDKFFVSRRKGHEIFCEYYFSLIKGKDKSTPLKYILSLAQHIAYGGLKEAYVKEFLNFPSPTVNSSDPHSNRTLLHLVSTINSTDVLELFLRHFSDIDCVDSRGMTPAFLAAQHGLADNLALLVKKGANVNRKTKSIVAVHKSKTRAAFQEAQNKPEVYGFDLPYIDMPVYQSKSKFFNATMLHAAAQGGHINVVRFLLDNNVTISTMNGAHLSAIQLAAENGHLEVVKTLHEAGAVADQTALHHAAANNRLEVVKFLLDIGVKDVCLRCDGSFYWLKTRRRFQQRCSQMKDVVGTVEYWIESEETFWKDVDIEELFDDKHLIYCHSALHAAVASGHDKVVSRLLSEEHNALHCHDYTGRTPLHEAIRKNDTKIVNLLLQKQPQLIHYKCKHWQHIADPVFHEDRRVLYDMLSVDEFNDYSADICHCGYSPLHLAARYGHKHLGVLLIVKGARVNEGDCNGATPFHVAACNNQFGFISILSHPKIGGDINRKTQNGSTPLHSAAVCGAIQAIDYLLYHGANISAVDDYGSTALHYSAMFPSKPSSQFGSECRHCGQGVFVNDSQWSDGTFRLHEIDRMGNFLGFYEIMWQIDNIPRSALKGLDTPTKLVLKGSDVDAVDISGQTPLHIAAQNGLLHTLRVLLKGKASVELRDNRGNTPLELAVENAPLVIGSYNIVYGMVVNFLLAYGASPGECNRLGSSLLHKAILKRQPLIVQKLLLKGASLSCKDNFGRTPLITYLQNGGEWIDAIINAFTTSVTIKCGEPFNSSAFHLLSYHPPTVAHDNFFFSSTCKFYNPAQCEVKKGSLAEAIENHPKKQEIVNSCLDAEGFVPLHRAAQGGNVVAIHYLLASGANDTILSPDGLDALTMAVLYSGRNMWQLYGAVYVPERVIGMSPASNAAIALLNHAMFSRGYQVKCNVKKPNLTLYHLAAACGLADLTQLLLQERDLHQLDVNCSNKDGITPLYLAKLFGNGLSGPYFNPWDRVMNIIQSHGGEMRYPRKDAEYNAMFNRLYGWIPNNFMLDLKPGVRRFIVSLLTLYEKRENNSFLCSFANYDYGYNSMLSQLSSIRKEIGEVFDRQMRLGDDHFLAMKEILLWDMTRCSWRNIGLNDYFLRFQIHQPTYPKYIGTWRNWEDVNRNQRNWFQRELRFLMQLRRVEVFESFACFKSMYLKLKPFRHTEKLKFLIKQYEKSPPHSFYLTHICRGMQSLFKDYLSRHKPKSVIYLSFIRDNQLDFVRERMKMYTGRSSSIPDFAGFGTFGDIIEWPLEFLLKRFLGLFQRYDYLNILHVGMETEKLENMFRKLI